MDKNKLFFDMLQAFEQHTALAGSCPSVLPCSGGGFTPTCEDCKTVGVIYDVVIECFGQAINEFVDKLVDQFIDYSIDNKNVNSHLYDIAEIIKKCKSEVFS